MYDCYEIEVCFILVEFKGTKGVTRKTVIISRNTFLRTKLKYLKCYKTFTFKQCTFQVHIFLNDVSK